eukprot:SAG31_NODE_25_length_33055_cov_11.407919_7_plen_87_part_00
MSTRRTYDIAILNLVHNYFEVLYKLPMESTTYERPYGRTCVQPTYVRLHPGTYVWRVHGRIHVPGVRPCTRPYRYINIHVHVDPAV